MDGEIGTCDCKGRPTPSEWQVVDAMNTLKKNMPCMLLMIFLSGCLIQRFGKPQNSYITPLMDHSTNLSAPVWSPTSQEITATIFSYPRYHSSIKIYNLETKKDRVLIETDGRIETQAWSPDGKLIAFVSFGAKEFEEGIWTIEVNGTNPAYMGKGVAVTWSPDGKQMAILYCAGSLGGKNSQAEIRLIDIESLNETVIQAADTCVSNFYLDWAPNGNRLAYSYARNPSLDNPSDRIFVLDLNSMQTTSIINELSWNPTWSADGHWVAFIKSRDRPVTSTVAFYNIQKACAKTLDFSEFSMVGEAAWSPDGKLLALTSEGNIYIANLEGLTGKDYLECP